MKFGYGVVLEVLARVNGIDAERRSAFKARMQYYREAGLLSARGAAPSGIGRHTEYHLEDVYRLSFCLQLSTSASIRA